MDMHCITKWKTGSQWYRVKVKRNRGTDFVMWRPTLESAIQARDEFITSYEKRQDDFATFYKEWREQEYLNQLTLGRKKYTRDRNELKSLWSSSTRQADTYSRTWFEERRRVH